LGSIALGEVTFDNSFAGHETFTFGFTDSTSFSVEGNIVGNLGVGTTQAKFTSRNRFSVITSNWSGIAQTGDEYYITASSDISDEDGEDFITDATRMMNAYLERKYGSLDDVDFYNDTSIVVPEAIQFACIRYAAFDIFNSIHAGISIEGESPVERWKIQAEETFSEYLSGHGKGPVWKSRASTITELGIEGVKDGVIDIDELSDAKNKQYER